MKIKSNGNVSAIRLKHESLELNLELILPKMFQNESFAEPSNIAFLEFKDTMEIEQMIAILTRFKGECADGLGQWRSTDKDGR